MNPDQLALHLLYALIGYLVGVGVGVAIGGRGYA